MNEEKHFLEAISAGEPNTDLIYADWLEEQGRPEADEIRDPVVFALQRWSRSRSRYRFRSHSRSRSRFHQLLGSSRSQSHFWHFTSYSFSRSCHGTRLWSESSSWSLSCHRSLSRC